MKSKKWDGFFFGGDPNAKTRQLHGVKRVVWLLILLSACWYLLQAVLGLIAGDWGAFGVGLLVAAVTMAIDFFLSAAFFRFD